MGFATSSVVWEIKVWIIQKGNLGNGLLIDLSIINTPVI